MILWRMYDTSSKTNEEIRTALIQEWGDGLMVQGA